MIVPLAKAYAGKRVFVTGHTGFKGSWLCEWLLSLEAEVWGFGLAPATNPALFKQLGLGKRLNHVLGDLRNPGVVKKAVSKSRPDFVFHLAAQPIVYAAHLKPADTWSTNVMGTVHLLDALRTLSNPCAVVIVTTDKVYGERSEACTEQHPLAASDPYGSSKAASELAVAAWRRAYFQSGTSGPNSLPMVGIATARSGNVIGGGDWAKGRLVPDCVRALGQRRPILLRNPAAVRPWQHVMDPLAGYLSLAAQIHKALALGDRARLATLSSPFNFAPAPRDHRTVQQLVEAFTGLWPGSWRLDGKKPAFKETSVLRLNARKAASVLGWEPRWRFHESVSRTVEWYRAAKSPSQALAVTLEQIAAFNGA